MNDLKLQKANEEKVAQENLDAAKALAAELETKQVMVKIKAGEGGKTLAPYLPRRSQLPARNSMALKSIRRKLYFPRA